MLVAFKEIWAKFKEGLGFVVYKTENNEITILKVALFALILILTFYLVKLFERFFKRSMAKQENVSEKGSQLAILQIIKYVIYTIGLLIAIQSVGIDITLLLAGSAALFVGLGFGIQQTFRDLVAGLILLFEGSVKVGDIVRSEDLEGEVKKIGIRTSMIETKDKIFVIVPNSLLTDRQFVNYSYGQPVSRFFVRVGVAYDSDVDLVKNLLMEAAEEHGEIVKKPPPNVIFRDFGDSALIFDLFFTTRKILHVEIIRSHLRFSIIKKFRKHGITIPFPQRDLNFKNVLEHLPAEPEVVEEEEEQMEG